MSYLVVYKNKIPPEITRDLRLALYHKGVSRIRVNPNLFIEIDDSLSPEKMIEVLNRKIDNGKIKAVVSYGLFNDEISKFLNSKTVHIVGTFSPEFYLHVLRTASII